MSTATSVIVQRDWQGVKDRPENRVDVIVTAALGEPARYGPRHLEWRCPWHHDPTPSFKVDLQTNTWKCWAECGQGDVYDFLCKFYGMDVVEAYEHLSGENPNNELPQPTVNLSALPPIPEPRERREIEFAEVKQYAAAPEAIAYFASRGISEETVREYYLGYQEKPHPVTTWDAKNPIGWVTRGQFTIPHFMADGTIAAVKCRRDDARCREDLAAVPDSIFMPVLEYLTAINDGKAPTERALLDTIFGGRFAHWTGGSGETIFNERVLKKVLPDGTAFRPVLPYVLIVEAEIDALYLRDVGGDKGFAAIAAKAVGKINFKRMLANATDVYIIQDNDPDKMNKQTGKKENAGVNLAQKLQARIGRAVILHPPEHNKQGGRVRDVNDLSPEELIDWLHKQGIMPRPRALI